MRGGDRRDRLGHRAMHRDDERTLFTLMYADHVGRSRECDHSPDIFLRHLDAETWRRQRLREILARRFHLDEEEGRRLARAYQLDQEIESFAFLAKVVRPEAGQIRVGATNAG